MAWLRTIARLALLSLLAAVAACASVPSAYNDTATGNRVDFQRLAGAIGDRRVIFIGEAHDSPRDHAVQLAVIRWLVESGRDVTVALEMFTPPDQEVLNAWVGGGLDEFQFQKRYAARWEMPYENYRDIFLYARRKGIPLYGINADRRLVAALARDEVRNVPAEVLDMLRFTPCVQAPDYAAAIGMAGVSSRHEKGMSNLCDAERYRDSMLAYNVSRILASRRGTVVVLLGIGHAMKQAVPTLLAGHTDTPYVVLLPEEVRMLSGHEPGPGTADFTW